MKSAVIYSHNALTIVIPTRCPEATHELLMRGISSSLRKNITSTDRQKDEQDGLATLTLLLDAIIPTEEMLTKD